MCDYSFLPVFLLWENSIDQILIFFFLFSFSHLIILMKDVMALRPKQTLGFDRRHSPNPGEIKSVWRYDKKNPGSFTFHQFGTRIMFCFHSCTELILCQNEAISRTLCLGNKWPVTLVYFNQACSVNTFFFAKRQIKCIHYLIQTGWMFYPFQ